MNTPAHIAILLKFIYVYSQKYHLKLCANFLEPSKKVKAKNLAKRGLILGFISKTVLVESGGSYSD